MGRLAPGDNPDEIRYRWLSTPAMEEWVRRGILELEFYANKDIHEQVAEHTGTVFVCMSCGSIGGHTSSCDSGPADL